MPLVPPVTRMTVEQATATIEAASLTVGQLIQTEVLLVAPVRVVGTVPTAGTEVESGSAVDLKISKVYQP